MIENQTAPHEYHLYGKWIEGYAAIVSVILFGFFWHYRSFVYSGDGDQIERMVEAGYWMVHSELLSQSLFQLVYRILHPLGWDGLSVIQLVSCLAGAVSIYVLLRFNQRYIQVDPLWVLGLFFSSGLALYCNGHTEYYTQFLVFLFLYGYVGMGYLRHQYSARTVALIFSLAAWIHLGILFALPSLLALPVFKNKYWRDYIGIGTGLLPLAFIPIFKLYCSMFGLYIYGLSPSTNFVPLTPDPARPDWYTFLSVWHIADWVYGWAMRSWIYWFVILLGIYAAGWRSVLKPERLFLFLYTFCYVGFTIVWHPNLGMNQDWDLFAFEAAPCLLLVLSYMPVIIPNSFYRTVVAVPVITSMLIMVHFIYEEAQFDRRGYSTVTLQMKQPPNNITVNGHNQFEETIILRQGHYSVKILLPDGKKDFFVHTAPNSHLPVDVSNIPFTRTEIILP